MIKSNQSLKLTVVVVGLFLIISSDLSGAYKILMIPLIQKSHLSCMLSIADELDARGHEVHMLQYDKFNIPMTSQAPGSKVKHWFFELNKDIPLNESRTDMEKSTESFARSMLDTKASFKDMIAMVNKNSVRMCSLILLNTDWSFRKLEEEGFDLAVVDGTMFSKCFYLIPHRLKIPWITYTDYPEPWLIRTPWLSSFVPHHFSTFTDRMTFAERTKNTLLSIYLYFYAPQLIVDDAILKEYRRFGDFNALDDFVSKSELFLITSDVVLDYAKPSMPNLIEVGGLTTGEPGKLPDNLRLFMDAAEKGVVVVTFGSMLSTFPPDLAEKFASVFFRLEGYRVVWRMTNSDNVTLPSNVLIAKWLPQSDVLGHRKTKLFITHCGNNGQFEGIYNKVPMIGFPFHGDQKYNAIRLEQKGYGVAMNIFDFTADQLLSNIQRILADTRYTGRVSRASDIFKSAPETPAVRSARWIEHVLVFGGSHLRSAGSDLAMYQYFLLDVLVTFAVVVSILLIFVCKLARCLLRKYSFVGKCGKVGKENKKEN